MSKLVPFQQVSIEQIRPATETAAKVHVAGAAEKAALRAKDTGKLREASDALIDARYEFAAGYRAAFPAGNQYTKSADASTGAGTPESYCERFGFAQRTVQRWAERMPDVEHREKEKSERFAKLCKTIDMEQSANFSSESVEWYTPAKYVEAARKVLGEIDLDPASSPKANETVKAKRFFMYDDVPLEEDWNGRVFMNPPYGKLEDGLSSASAFCQKAIAEFALGHCTACILLVNSVHSQSWQEPLYDPQGLVCFVNHRIQFVSGDGEENKNPTFQNIFVYLGPEQAKFAEVFSEFGYVMKRWTP